MTASGLSLGVTLGISLAAAIAVGTIVMPAFLAGPWGAYLPRSTNDTEAFATREALWLALQAPVGDPNATLVLVSDSILAQTLASDIAVAAALQAQTGKAWRVSFLTTPLQDPMDQMTLADYASRRQPGLFVLPIGFEKFAATADGVKQLYNLGRLGLRSDWADQAISKLGGHPRPKTGVYVIDNSSFVLRNATIMALRSLTHWPAKRVIAAYSQPTKVSALELLARRRSFERYLAAAASGQDFAFSLLTDTIQHLRDRQGIVILAEEPVSPDMISDEAAKAAYARYRAKAASFAKSTGAFYCDLPLMVEPQAEDFSDLIHIANESTQRAYREALIRCVVAALTLDREGS